ncbi:MAG: type II secretion system F family protein [Candidatus Methanomethylicaceae archaeon]|jgi:flagellar protein FlaJ
MSSDEKPKEEAAAPEKPKQKRSFFESLKQAFSRKPKGTEKEKPQEKKKGQYSDITGIAFGLFGGFTPRTLKYFEGLEIDLKRAGLKTTLVKYVSKMYFMSLIAFIVALIVSIPLLLVFLYPFFAIVTSFAIGLLAGAIAFIAQFIYPKYVINNRKNGIERNLSFITNYMAILAGAGVIPEKIFRSVADSNLEPTIKFEVSEIIRRMEVFGEDFYTAVSVRIEECASPKFSELLRGILLVGSTGGDMKRYLFLQGKRFMRMKNISLKKALDGLGIMAEIYVTAGIVMPLIMVVMLCTLSFLGGGSINALLWLDLVSYLIVPMISIVMLVLIDSSVPSEV